MEHQGTTRHPREESPGNNVISLLYRHAAEIPDRAALRWIPHANSGIGKGQPPKHSALSFGELAARIARLAGGLRSLGLGKGDRVLVFLPMSPQMYTAMFAVQQIGAAAVFLDSWARRDQLGVCAEIVRPTAMISFEQAFHLVAPVPSLQSVAIKIVAGAHSDKYSSELESLMAGEESREIAAMALEDTALITFTTGSSGRPKGADRTHGFLFSQHKALDAHLPYRPDDVDLPCFPIFSLNNMAGGVTTVIPAIDLANPAEDDPKRLALQIRDCAVTCATLSPDLFRRLADFGNKQKLVLKGLRRVVTGGAPVSRKMVLNFNRIADLAEIRILYGSTEIEPIAGITGSELLSLKDTSQGVCAGRLDPGLRYRLLRIPQGAITLSGKKWADLEAPPHTAGELIVSGEHVCNGYYNDPHATARAKIVEDNGTVWHRTGDVGIFDRENRLWLLGRVHNTIVREGRLYFPVHAENLLKNLSFVDKAAYIGLPDPVLGERICAAVTLSSQPCMIVKSEYITKIEELLKKAEIKADEVRVLDDIPMDPRHHSKVEYDVLRSRLTSGEE